MNHSFLLEVGHWTVAGNWLEGSDLLIVSGEIDVSWQQQNVFELEMQLRFTNIMEYESRPVIYYNYQGFIGTRYRQYSYIYSRSEEEEGKKNIIEKVRVRDGYYQIQLFKGIGF